MIPRKLVQMKKRNGKKSCDIEEKEKPGERNGGNALPAWRDRGDVENPHIYVPGKRKPARMTVRRSILLELKRSSLPA